MLEISLPADIFDLFLVFARLGGALMLLPGFGEAYVTPRVRLAIALLFTLLVTPVVLPDLPDLPASPLGVLVLVVRETLVGVFFGVLARLMMSALQMAGMIVGYQLGIANAFSFDPTSAQQGALIGTFLAILAVLLIFVSGLHHMLIGAVINSYDVFPPGAPLPMVDFAAAISETAAKSFLIAVQICAPFLVVGLLFYAGVGLLGRLMPQVQIFFVALPVQLGIGLFVFAISLSVMMMWFLNSFQETMTGL